MTRRFAEIVHVGVSGTQPAVFRWRGTRYVVREVLGHWRERRSWWATPVVQAVMVGAPVEARVGWNTALGEEYEVWRVEANRRGGGALGVYDLCHDTGVRPDTGAWRLLRIAD